MSSDLLPLPEIWPDLPKGDAPQSARSDVVANARSGLVLIEYASGYAQPDSHLAVRTADRAEQAAASAHIPSFAAAALAKGLSDLSAIVIQAETLLRAQGTLKGDVHFAVERIHDVALALRMRDVDAALCDTLHASVREVGDAVVRHEAAATGALSAAALLRDILNRIEDLTRVASDMIAPGAEPRGSAEVAVVAAPALASTDVRAPIAALAPAAFDRQVAVERPRPVAGGSDAWIEAPAPAGEARPGPEAAQPADSAAGPQAYSLAAPEADKADLPVTAAADVMKADNVTSESTAFNDGMPGLVVADEDRAPALHTAAVGDTPALGARLSREPPGVEPNDEQVFEVTEPAAAQLQAEIGLADQIEVANEIDVADEIRGADEIAVIAEAVVGDVASEQNRAAGTPPVSEAAIAALHVESGEHDSRQCLSSVVLDKNAAPESLPPRPVNDSLAAFHGLSESELIALFT